MPHVPAGEVEVVLDDLVLVERLLKLVTLMLGHRVFELAQAV